LDDQCHALATLPLGEGRGVHFAGGWVSSRTSLDKKEKYHPHWDLIPKISSLKQITILTKLS
jgi:hypothetical protein